MSNQKYETILNYTKQLIQCGHTIHTLIFLQPLGGNQRGCHLVLHGKSKTPLWLTWHTTFNATVNQMFSAVLTTLNTPISEGGTNSSHTHNPVKSQSYQVLKLLLSDTKFMTIVKYVLIYHRFQENQCVLVISARHMLVNEQCKVPID